MLCLVLAVSLRIAVLRLLLLQADVMPASTGGIVIVRIAAGRASSSCRRGSSACTTEKQRHQKPSPWLQGGCAASSVTQGALHSPVQRCGAMVQLQAAGPCLASTTRLQTEELLSEEEAPLCYI